MCALLKAAQTYLDRFSGIRISTRPDAIDEEVLALLKRFGVTEGSVFAGAYAYTLKLLSGQKKVLIHQIFGLRSLLLTIIYAYLLTPDYLIFQDGS